MRDMFYLVILSLLLPSFSLAFIPASRFAAPIKLQSTSTTETSTKQTTTIPDIKNVRVDPSTYDTPNDQIMQVASYRNFLRSPEMMIAKQQAKRNEAGMWGWKVYVPDMKDARNRLTVDFVASLKIKQDVGFAAYLENECVEEFMGGRFVGSSGIVGCVDVQVRNSNMSEFSSPLENGVLRKTYPGLPPHIHIKNMDVDVEMRRRGIGKKLMNAIEDWAKTSTDAELLTLEVRDANDAGLRTYESCGFVKDKQRKARQLGCSFMTKTLVR